MNSPIRPERSTLVSNTDLTLIQQNQQQEASGILEYQIKILKLEEDFHARLQQQEVSIRLKLEKDFHALLQQEANKRLKLEDEVQLLKLQQTSSSNLTSSVSFGEYYISRVVPKIKLCNIGEWIATADETILNKTLDLSQGEKLLQYAFEKMLRNVQNQLPHQIRNASQIRYVPGLKNRSPDLSFLPKDVTFQKGVLAKFVSVVGELKKADENIESDESLGQICCYLERLSEQNGGRSVYGFITNFTSAIFLQARSGNMIKRTKQFTFVKHQGDTKTTVLYYFKSLLIEAAKHLPDELKGFTILKCIGEGKTSYVFQVDNATQSRKVLKLKKETESSWPFQTEADVLNAIYVKKEFKNSFNLIENVPRVENSDRKTFLLFSTQYETLTKYRLTKTNVIQFLNFLQFLHNEKIFHRDIRPSNLSYNSAHKSIVLLDFGYATSSDPSTFAGTLTYAATEVLESFLHNSSKFVFEIEFESKYDVESFVKSFYYLAKHPFQITTLDRQCVPNGTNLMKKIEEVIIAWRDVEKSDEKFHQLMLSIRQGNSLSNQQLCDNLFDLIEQMP